MTSSGVPASAAPANCNPAEVTNTDRVHAKQPSRNARRKKLKRQMRRQGLLSHADTGSKPGTHASNHNGRATVATQAVVSRTASASQKQGCIVAQDKQRPRDLTKATNASLHHAAQRPTAKQSSGDDESENGTSTDESSSDHTSKESTSGSESDALTDGSSDTEESSNPDNSAQEEEDQKQTKAQHPGTEPPASRCPRSGRFADAASPRHLRVESNKHGKAELKGRLPQETSLPTETVVGNPQQAQERIPNGSGIPLSTVTIIETRPELVNGVALL